VLKRNLQRMILIGSILGGTLVQGAEIPTNLAGGVSCAGFLKARAEGDTQPFEQWLSGYLTGLATYDRRINQLAKLQAANGATGTLLLESYCKRYPQASYQVAAREMARSVFYGPGK
jgi:hypothetical protein